jgi:hypothetical protein
VRGDQPDARPLPTHRTTQDGKTRTHIHASSGIRTHDASVRGAEDSACLRPLGHWDRHIINYLRKLCFMVYVKCVQSACLDRHILRNALDLHSHECVHAIRTTSNTPPNTISIHPDARSEVFMAIQVQVEVFCVVTPCSASEDHATSIFRVRTTRRHNPEDLDLNHKPSVTFT